MKELDWANLPFGYMKTDYNVRIWLPLVCTTVRKRLRV